MKRLFRRLVRLLILIPLAIAVVALATVNRQDVAINLDPFAGSSPEGIQVTVPLILVVFLAIMLGVILGGGVTYMEQGKYRRAARRVKGELDSLKAEIARLTAPRTDEKRRIP